MRRIRLAPPPDARAALSLDYAAALDPQQHAAATAGGGPTLVVAGAGTGKTRTVVYRLAYLVETGTPPEAIVLLTFSRRAAAEMVRRAAGLLDGRCERARGGTFHAFGLETLRRHAERAGYPSGFTVLDAQDAADVIDLARTEMGMERAPKRFPKKRTLQAMFSAVVNRGVPLAEVLDAEYPQYAGHLDAIEALRQRFDAAKRRLGLLDYDDLLARCLDLLDDDAVAPLVAGRCRHVLVDEYQDVNRLQAEIVARLASVHGNVTAVGDDAQSIYRFRGADVRHILDFPSRYPGARVLKLEHNYRSTQPVLDLANRVLEGAARQVDKRLFTDRTGGERPVLVRAPDDDWEARFVVQIVLDKREAGVPLHRMAVLFRSSWCSYTLEAELTRRGVPFVKFGGLRLAEAAHVKDLVAHLRIAENPADAVAWNRALRLLDGVGPATARRLLDAIGAAAGTPNAADALRPLLHGAPPAVRDGLAALVATLADLRRDGLRVGAQVERLLDYYRPVLERVYADDFPKREPDLDAFAALAARHRTRSGFLEALALDPLDLTSEGVDPAVKDEPPLVLSTVHSAKGLEFDTVFLIHALDGVLPSQYTVGSVEEEDEERRLLYVALTRAETDLFVSVPLVQHRRGSGAFLAEPSRFLQGIPETLLEPAVLVDDEPAPALGPGA